MFNQKKIEELENIWYKYKNFQWLEQWKEYRKNLDEKEAFIGRRLDLKYVDDLRINDAPFLVTYQINQYSRIKTRRFNTFKRVESFIKNLHKKNIWLHNVWRIDDVYKINMVKKYAS